MSLGGPQSKGRGPPTAAYSCRLPGRRSGAARPASAPSAPHEKRPICGGGGTPRALLIPRKRRQNDPTAGQGRGETPRSPGGPDGTVMGRLRIGAGGTGRAGAGRVNGGRSPGAFKHPQEHRGDASARGQPRKSAREGSAPPPPDRPQAGAAGRARSRGSAPRHRRGFSCLRFPFYFPISSSPSPFWVWFFFFLPSRTRKTDVKASADSE